MASGSGNSNLNEAACPVELPVLALLLRSDERAKAALIATIEPRVRARLALFCYHRSHLRPLGFLVANLCELKDLRFVAGPMADVIREQSGEAGAFGEENAGPRRKSVTLARSARG